jgi:hypothetical protein
MFFDRELELLWVLRTSASGWQKISVQESSSEILECGLFCPKQEKRRAWFHSTFMHFQLKNQTYNYSACGEKLKLARNYSLL